MKLKSSYYFHFFSVMYQLIRIEVFKQTWFMSPKDLCNTKCDSYVPCLRDLIFQLVCGVRLFQLI